MTVKCKTINRISPSTAALAQTQTFCHGVSMSLKFDCNLFLWQNRAKTQRFSSPAYYHNRVSQKVKAEMKHREPRYTPRS